VARQESLGLTVGIWNHPSGSLLHCITSGHCPTILRRLTIGDHIRRRRLSLRLQQTDVAERIGVHETSVFNWEANTSSPGIQFMPAVITFLGYNPLPAAEGLGGRLARQRTSLGMTQKAAAKCLGVDPSTLARWERGEREPQGVFRERVQGFLREGAKGGRLRQAG
jgi:transcriptional regulator with XRE-family HTH domain